MGFGLTVPAGIDGVMPLGIPVFRAFRLGPWAASVFSSSPDPNSLHPQVYVGVSLGDRGEYGT